MRDRIKGSFLSFTLGRGASSESGKGGFTLLELLVVMLILGLAVGLSSFFFIKGREKREAEGFLKDFQMALSQARIQAISHGERVSLFISPEDRTLWVDQEKKVKIPKDVSLKSRDVPLEGNDVVAFSFYPDGSNGGGDFFVKWGDKEWRLRINPVTGVIYTSLVSP